MDKLLFGISGLPAGSGNEKFTYKTAITYLSDIGLDAMELPFVRNVNVTEKNKEEILNEKIRKNFYISAHGSYFINLNADEIEKQEQSMQRIIKGASALKLVEGKSLVFHPGFYLSDNADEAYDTIKENLIKLPEMGIDYRLETTGKPTQFGSIEELLSLCSAIPHCKICIDFSHIHARGNGCLKKYEDFTHILDLVISYLGECALNDLHIHMSGINYGPKGEKNHLPFEESDFKYELCIRAFKDYNVKGCIICESPILEHDALLLKNLYEKL